MAIQMEVYTAKESFFILAANHVTIFHQLLNGKYYFDIVSKSPN